MKFMFKGERGYLASDLIHRPWSERITMVCKGRVLDFESLKDQRIPKGALFIMDNHGHARKVFELARMQGVLADGSTVLRFDAHDDLGVATSFVHRPSSFEEIISLNDPCGAYLHPCLLNGLFKEVILVDSPDQEVPQLGGVPVDIDLDFFNKLVHPQSEFLKNLFVEWNIRKFIQKLKGKVDPVFTTIAISKGHTLLGREKQFLKAVLDGFSKP